MAAQAAADFRAMHPEIGEEARRHLLGLSPSTSIERIAVFKRTSTSPTFHCRLSMPCRCRRMTGSRPVLVSRRGSNGSRRWAIAAGSPGGNKPIRCKSPTRWRVRATAWPRCSPPVGSTFGSEPYLQRRCGPAPWSNRPRTWRCHRRSCPPGGEVRGGNTRLARFLRKPHDQGDPPTRWRPANARLGPCLCRVGRGRDWDLRCRRCPTRGTDLRISTHPVRLRAAVRAGNGRSL